MSLAPRKATAHATTGPGGKGQEHAAVKGKEVTRTPRERKGAKQPNAAGHAVRHSLLFHGKKKQKRGARFWIVCGVILAAVAGICAWVAFSEFEWAKVTQFINTLEPALVIPLMALLPVVGFPISVVYLVAGARFGAVGGGVVVAAVTAVHLLLTHLIATGLLRHPVRRFVESRYKPLPEIPRGEHGAVAVIGALAPGLPYVLRNYILALSGVRLRTYFWICLPIYVARSYVTILLGDMSSAPSGSRLAILLTVDAVKIGVCGGVIWWLRRRHRKNAPKAHHAGDEEAR